MTAVAMPMPSALTSEEMKTISELSAFGLKLIGEGASYHKIATVFNDIRKLTFSPEQMRSVSMVVTPEDLCSECQLYLPNLAKYERCLATCTA
jgi:hypothetical protein